MKLQAISKEAEQTLLESFMPVSDWKEIGPFCVDGRDGDVAWATKPANEHLYVQALGGSMLIAVIRFLQAGTSYSDILHDTINELQAHNFGCGVHRGSHCDGQKSDCGFADNLQLIINRLATQHNTIRQSIESAAPGVINDEVWDQIVSDAHDVSTKDIDGGERLIASCENDKANVQTLQGEHAEIAAIVNLTHGTTFNTGKLAAQDMQAFNLDLWYVLEQSKLFGLEDTYTTLAALGLYVATEMVLVEDKKQVRLPIIVRM